MHNADMSPQGSEPIEDFEFAVELGNVREFEAATLSRNSAQRLSAQTAQTCRRGIPVPPTFLMAALAGRRIGICAADTLPGGVRSLYGEQQFDYLEPVFAGDVLKVRPGSVTTTQRHGRRGGIMTLTVTETVYERQGRKVVVARGTRITTSTDVSAMGRPGDAVEPVKSSVAPVEYRRLRAVSEGPVQTLDDVAILDAVEKVVEITRVHIARYAGASGDFAPIHLDDEFAKSYGNPSVFAHGMLSGGIAATLVSDWLGALSLRHLQMRFTSRVFPGDVIRFLAVLRSIERHQDHATLTCELVASNQHLEQVLSGTAIAQLPVNNTCQST